MAICRKTREIFFFFLGAGLCCISLFFSGVLTYVLLLAGGAILCIPRHSTIPVLAYHSIHQDSMWMGAPDLVVSPKLFGRQIDFLTKIGWKTIWMDELLEIRLKKLPGRYVAIHFDDGYHDCLTQALPILKHYAAKGTAFVSPGLIRGTPQFSEIITSVKLVEPASLTETMGLPTTTSTSPLPPEVFLSCDDLVTLSHSNIIEIQAHAWTHRELAKLPVEEVKAELTLTKKWLSEFLGKPISHLCFPRDSFSPEIIAASHWAGYSSYTGAMHNNDNQSAHTSVSRMYVTESGHLTLDMLAFCLDILLFKGVYAVWPFRALIKRVVRFSWEKAPQPRRTP